MACKYIYTSMIMTKQNRWPANIICIYTEMIMTKQHTVDGLQIYIHINDDDKAE